MYGLQAGSGAERPVSVEVIVCGYLRAIREVQPNGPDCPCRTGPDRSPWQAGP
ncbi:hypothetical protein [Streptomyces anulatus]|uniref:hypothetical protein n=1 Tax=Streptomyces anulatus TaxID=1892 RepID=UPI0036448650